MRKQGGKRHGSEHYNFQLRTSFDFSVVSRNQKIQSGIAYIMYRIRFPVMDADTVTRNGVGWPVFVSVRADSLSFGRGL